MRPVGTNRHAQSIYATPFHQGCVTSEAPTDECIDCFVLLCGAVLDTNMTNVIARELAAANNDWVHVLGIDSQPLHNAIDRFSVELGRQRAVGDGVPMTSWHDDLTTVDEMAAFIACGGLGAAPVLIAVVVGEEAHFLTALDALERQLSAEQE